MLPQRSARAAEPIMLKERIDYFKSEAQTTCSNPAVVQEKVMKLGNFRVGGSFVFSSGSFG